MKNSNANLMGLTCKDQNDNNCTFSPAFSSSVTSYSMTVDNKVTSLKITPQVANDKAVAEVSGASDLQVGENTVVIKVTADSGWKVPNHLYHHRYKRRTGICRHRAFRRNPYPCV